MDKEDRIIKTLLENKFTVKAPGGFTDRVMEALESVELQKQQRSAPADWPYLLAVAGTVFVTIGVLSAIDPSFIAQYYHLLSGYAFGFFHQLTGIFSNLQPENTAIDSNGQLVIGTLFIMFILLLFDSFIRIKRRGLSLFFFI